MSLDTHVFGDPASCYVCADSLASLAAGVNDQLKSARDGRTESEYEFKSTAGDKFRSTLDRIITGTTEAADRIAVIAAALRVLADEFVTARARMSQAEETASEASIPVEFGTGIGDTVEVDQSSYDVAPQILRAKQVVAYETAAGLVAEGRGIEVAAHSTFAEALRGPTTILKNAEASGVGWPRSQSPDMSAPHSPSCRNGARSPIPEARIWPGYTNSPRKQPGWATRTRKPPQPELFGPSKVGPTTRRDSPRRTPGCSRGSVTTSSSSFSAVPQTTTSRKDRRYHISDRRSLSSEQLQPVFRLSVMS